jgi:hypothetical protein
MSHKYGYKRGLADHRDHKFAFSGDPITLPEIFNSVVWGEVFDQGDLGSCLANAGVFCLKSWMIRNAYPYPYVPSRLKLYFDARFLDGDPEVDAGTDPGALFKAMNQLGVCPENENSSWNWPYDVSKFAQKPPPQCYADAKLHKLIQYAQVNQDIKSVKAALVAGFNLVIGISVFQQIESQQAAKTGIIELPSSNDSVIGGHGLALTGYDATYAIGVNSWGSDWGDHGRFYIPWSYILNPDLCTDIVAVGMVT